MVKLKKKKLPKKKLKMGNLNSTLDNAETIQETVTCGTNTALNEFTKQCVGAFDEASYCGTNTAAANGKCVPSKTAICGTGTRYDDTESQCMIDKYELGPGVRLNSQKLAQVDDSIFTQSVVWDPVNTAVTASSGAVSSFCNSEKDAVYDVSSNMCVADTANLLAQKCTAAKGLQYNAIDDTCESALTTTDNTFCGTHTELGVEGRCRASLKACDSNVMTYDATTAKCALAEDACGVGTTLKAGKCVADGSVCATDNMTFDDEEGACVVNKCPEGTMLVDGQCELDMLTVCPSEHNLKEDTATKRCVLDDTQFGSDTAEVKGDATTGFKCQAKNSACGVGTVFDASTKTCKVRADVCPPGHVIQDDRCEKALPDQVRAAVISGRHVPPPNNAPSYIHTRKHYHRICVQKNGIPDCDSSNVDTLKTADLKPEDHGWTFKKVNKGMLSSDRVVQPNEYVLHSNDNKLCFVGSDKKIFCGDDPATKINDRHVFMIESVPDDKQPESTKFRGNPHFKHAAIFMRSKWTNTLCSMENEYGCNGMETESISAEWRANIAHGAEVKCGSVTVESTHGGHGDEGPEQGLKHVINMFANGNRKMTCEDPFRIVLQEIPGDPEYMKEPFEKLAS